MTLNYMQIKKVKDFFYNEEKVLSPKEIMEICVVPTSKLEFKNHEEEKFEKVMKKLAMIDENRENKKRKTYSITDAGIVWRNIYGSSFDGVDCKICENKKISFDKRKEWHMAHIVPFSKDGSNELDNLRPICATCNLSMRNNNLVDYCKKKYTEKFDQIMKELKIENFF